MEKTDYNIKFDKLINLLEELKQKPKFSTSVKFITTKDNCIEYLNPYIRLDPNKTYKAALTSFSTYNSMQNIFDSTGIGDQNNNFKFSSDKGKTWKTIKLIAGSYEIGAIDREIRRLSGISMDDKTKIYFKIETNVNRVSLTLGENYQVDFSVDHSLANLLGFEKRVYGSSDGKKSFNIGENLPKITEVNSIVIHCDIIEGGYLNGKETNMLYSFPAHKVPIGYKMIQEPRILAFYPIVKQVIDRIKISITDEKGNPINFSGEDIVIDILITEV